MCPHRSKCPKRDLGFLSRRDWIRIFAFGTATNLAFGRTKRKTLSTRASVITSPSAPASQPILASIPPSTNNSCVIPVKLSDFPTLQTVGGSVRFYFSNFFNPFTITRADTNLFYAFDSTCTHQGVVVDAYDSGTGQMYCSGHGSTYDIQGHVISGAGGPGQANLTQLPVTFDGNDLLQVELNSPFMSSYVCPAGPSSVPAIPLKIKDVAPFPVPPQTATRIKLVFPVIRQARYRVMYYSAFGATPMQVNFATSTSGTFSNTAEYYNPNPALPASSLTASDLMNPSFTIYVARPAGDQGFFTIEMTYQSTFGV